MKKAAFGLLVLALSASPGWAAGLTMTIRDGMVTLDAQDVTIRQILSEWARVGKTRIINLEGVTSGSITLKLDHVPEQTALDIILRSVPGYVAASRTTYVADASRYDRILIMTTTTSVAVRPPQPPGQTFQGTQLRSSPPLLTPGALPENVFAPGFNPAADQLDDDPALTAAAAAGLIAVPATSPGPTGLTPPFLPGMPASAAGSRQPAQPSTTTTAVPTNPWNVSPGTALPGLAPPPPQPSAIPPSTPLRPPLPDR